MCRKPALSLVTLRFLLLVNYLKKAKKWMIKQDEKLKNNRNSFNRDLYVLF